MTSTAPTRLGILCVVSGPSGSGKTTICHRAAAEVDGVAYSVSCTTREPREGEADGRDYHFLSTAEFEARMAAGDLLEYARVHQSHYYGTLKNAVLDHLREGTDVVMDLDVQGAAQLRESGDPEIRQCLIEVFILPPSLGELEARVLGRGPMPEDELSRRMRNADEEMRHWPRYDYTVVSASREEDFERFRGILLAERHRSSRLTLEV